MFAECSLTSPLLFFILMLRRQAPVIPTKLPTILPLYTPCSNNLPVPSYFLRLNDCGCGYPTPVGLATRPCAPVAFPQNSSSLMHFGGSREAKIFV
jgi:hypothetical protein